MEEKWLHGKSALFTERRARRENDAKAMRESRKSIKADDVELFWEAKNGNWIAALIAPELGFETRTLELDVHVHPPATRSMIHKHNEAILFCMRGNGHVIIEEERFDCAPGDTVFIPHGLFHQIFNEDPEEPLVLLAVKNHMLTEHIGELNIHYKPDEPTQNEEYEPGSFVSLLPFDRSAGAD